MSAVDEGDGGLTQIIQVLFALHPNFGAQELCGPLEVLSNARQNVKDPGMKSPETMLMPESLWRV